MSSDRNPIVFFGSHTASPHGNSSTFLKLLSIIANRSSVVSASDRSTSIVLICRIIWLRRRLLVTMYKGPLSDTVVVAQNLCCVKLLNADNAMQALPHQRPYPCPHERRRNRRNRSPNGGRASMPVVEDPPTAKPSKPSPNSSSSASSPSKSSSSAASPAATCPKSRPTSPTAATTPTDRPCPQPQAFQSPTIGHANAVPAPHVQFLPQSHSHPPSNPSGPPASPVRPLSPHFSLLSAHSFFKCYR